MKKYFPTFAAGVEKHQKLLASFLFVFNLCLVLTVVFIFLPQRQMLPSRVKRARPITALATAYGSQKHIFGSNRRLSSALVSEKVAGVQTVSGQALISVWLKNSQIYASYSNDAGASWQETASPLVPERVVIVAGNQDSNGDVHLVYESEGKIFYRKISGVMVDGQIKPENWLVSNPVMLDVSNLAHRPSLILANDSGLPVVVWSSESKRAGVKSTKIRLMRAKADPTKLANWCNAEVSDCGKPAYILVSGSANEIGLVPDHATFHPLLVQMPGNGDLYLFWSEVGRKKRGKLKLAVAKKEGEGWRWGGVTTEDELDAETFANFSLAAAVDEQQNKIVIVYVQKGGNTKVVAYGSDGSREDLLSSRLSSQFSLAVADGKYYLFYRRDDGKVSGRRYDGQWSEELLESPQEGGYPSVTIDEVNQKLFVVYTTLAGTIDFISYSLVEPTPTLTLEATPTATPSPELTPTLTPTVEPTVTPTTTSSPTIAPTVEPTLTSEPTLTEIAPTP